jgi:hypothetical protein
LNDTFKLVFQQTDHGLSLARRELQHSINSLFYGLLLLMRGASSDLTKSSFSSSADVSAIEDKDIEPPC